jgi:hypothetical protein
VLAIAANLAAELRQFSGPLEQCVTNLSARGHILSSKNKQVSSYLTYVNMECRDDKYPKIKICISVLIYTSGIYNKAMNNLS